MVLVNCYSAEEILSYAVRGFLCSCHTPFCFQDSERAAVVAAEERARRLEAQLQEEKVLNLSAHNVSSHVNFQSQAAGLLNLNLLSLKYLIGTPAVVRGFS